ncbi:hypothetical protein ABIE48_001334 [Paenibacillus sp. OAE614]
MDIQLFYMLIICPFIYLFMKVHLWVRHLVEYTHYIDIKIFTNHSIWKDTLLIVMVLGIFSPCLINMIFNRKVRQMNIKQKADTKRISSY